MSKSHRSYKKDPEDQEDISDGVGSFCPNRSIEKAFNYITEQMCFRNKLTPICSNMIIKILKLKLATESSFKSNIRFLNRSSRPQMFCKKGALKNFEKFTGKHLNQSLFFNKVADLRTATLLKKRLWHRCFPVNFATF